MSNSHRVVVVVPTRERPELAIDAAQSLLSQRRPGLEVVVSDNSVSEQSRARLAPLLPHQARVLRPPAPMPMVAHWQWALDEVLADPAVTHVGYLTDRMVVRPGEVARLLAVVAATPERVVTFDTDAVLDDVAPVRVHLNPWTGDVHRVAARDLVVATAHGRPSAALPRMLNSIAPRAVLEQVSGRYGSVFASASPDYCFAFRCLTVVEDVAHYDRSPYVHRGSLLSNGANIARGTTSDDSRRFAAELDRGLFESAPEPRLRGVLNAIMSEYCFVRDEAGPGELPDVDLPSYLTAVDRDLDRMTDAGVRTQQRALLAELGHRHVPFDEWRRAERLRVAGDARATATRLVARGVGFRATRPLWQATRHAPPSAEWLRWDSSADALAFARDIGRRRSARPRPVDPVSDVAPGEVLLPWSRLRAT